MWAFETRSRRSGSTALLGKGGSMFDLFLKYVIVVSLLQFGIRMNRLLERGDWTDIAKLEQASRTVLHIEWRPVSVFR